MKLAFALMAAINAGFTKTEATCASRVKSGRALPMRARDYANEAARAAGVQTVDG